MHQRLEPIEPALAPPSALRPSRTPAISDAADVVRRRWRAICVPIALALALATVYLHVTVPTFLSQTQVIIDPRLPQFIPGRASDDQLAWDTSQVESEIAVIQSERTSAIVVEKLHLDEDPTFRTPPTLLGRIVGPISGAFDRGPPSGAVDPRREAIDTIANGLNVRRTGLSYAIEISFAFPDPRRAQQVADGIAEAYIADQIAIRADAARLGGEWLQQRLMQLRDQMNVATRAVQVFRASHDYSVRRPSDPGPPSDQNVKDIDELDSDAATFRRIYESFLQKYTESVQRQSFPVSDARILTPASLPQVKNSPKLMLTYALALTLGMLSGLGVAVVLQKSDRTIRDARRFAAETGLDCLGSIAMPRRRGRAWLARLRVPSPMRSRPRVIDDRARVASALCLTAARDPGNPTFYSAMSALKAFVDVGLPGGRLGCIGVTSSSGQASASMLAGNLATLYAEEGWKTLLIDAELDRRTLSRATGLRDRPGLLDIVEQPVSDDAVLQFGPGLPDILPAGKGQTGLHCERAIGSPSMRALLRRAAETYDVVLVALPPASPPGPVLALSPHLDGLLLALRAGRDTRDRVAALLEDLLRARARIAGFVLVDAAPARAA